MIKQILKVIASGYGKSDLIEALKGWEWKIIMLPGKIFTGLHFSSFALSDRQDEESSLLEYKVLVTNKRTEEEFSVEGFCSKGMLFWFSRDTVEESGWKKSRLAGCRLRGKPEGKLDTLYEVIVEVKDQGKV